MKSIKLFWISLLPLLILCYSIFGQAPKLILPISHTNLVNSVSFSPDGKYIVTTSADNTAKVWNSISGLLVANLQGHTFQVVGASFSPDGKYIVTASWDKTARVWDLETGMLKFILGGHTDWVNNASFSPDGKYIVTASKDQTAKVWNAENGKLIATLKGHIKEVISASFSPICPDDPNGGKYILTCSWDSTSRIWNALSGQLVTTLKGHTNGVTIASFSPNGKYIITSSWDSTDRVWNGTNGQLIATMKRSTADVHFASFSPDGKYLVTASGGKTAKVWDADNIKLIATLEGHTGKVTSASFSPDSKFIVTGSTDDSIKVTVVNSTERIVSHGPIDTIPRVWNAANGKLIATLKGHNDKVNIATFSTNGKYIITVSFRLVQLWNPVSGKEIMTLQGHTSYNYSVSFSPNGKYILATPGGLFTKVWNTESGQLIANLKGNNNLFITNSAFSTDGNYIALPSANTVTVWNTVNGKVKFTLDGHIADEVTSASFSPDGKYIIAIGNTPRVWDATGGKPVSTLAVQDSYIRNAFFSPDGKYIITVGSGNPRIWNTVSGKLVASLKTHNYEAFAASFSPDQKHIVTVDGFTAKIWNTESGQLIATFDWVSDEVNSSAFSFDGKYIVTTDNNNVKIWNLTSGKLKTTLSGHTDVVISASFSPDGKYIVTASNDNTIRKWDAIAGKPIITLNNIGRQFKSIDFKNQHILNVNESEINISSLENGKSLYSFFALDSTDYLVRIPSGYYQSTPNASKLLYYLTKDLKEISFEQLDVKYNRPDLVLEAIGKTDSSIINAYRNAYYKRIKKLGIDTTSFRDGYSVPEADFVNRNDISSEQTNESLALPIHGTDNTYPLDRYNVWVNEVPLFGQRGISIRKNNANDFDKTVSIKLSQGENRIEVSVTNVNGTESYRKPLLINYIPGKPVDSKIYFIGIGINEFADSSNNLKWCVQDIRDLAKTMQSKYGQEFILLDTLFNKDVTLLNIKALKQKLLRTGTNDKVIISYSGHGLLSKDYNYYLSSYSVNFSKPEEGGIPYEEIENLLDSIPARKKILFLDACHSGEVDKDEIKNVNTSAAALAKNNIAVSTGSRGGSVTNTSESTGKLGSQNSFELMQSLFVNVGKGTGAIIISASGGVQFAQERSELGHGVFTYSLIEAIKNFKSIKVSALKKYVGDKVTELTNGLQKPTTRNELIAADWDVW